MIDIITEALEITRSKHDRIRTLKGYYKIPESIKEGREQLKMKSWQ